MKTVEEKTKAVTEQMLSIMEEWGTLSGRIEDLLKEVAMDDDIGSVTDIKADAIGDQFAKFVCASMLGMRAMGDDVPLDFMQHLVDHFDARLAAYQAVSEFGQDLGKRLAEEWKRRLADRDNWPEEVTDKDQ